MVKTVTMRFQDGSVSTFKDMRLKLDDIAKVLNRIIVFTFNDDNTYVPYDVPFLKLKKYENIVINENDRRINYPELIIACCGYYIFEIDKDEYLSICENSKVPKYLALKGWKRRSTLKLSN